MTGRRTFKAVIRNAGGGGAYVEIPFDVEKEYGSKKPRVKAEIEGISYRGTLMRMGTECHTLGILKSIREQAGRTFGDEVEVSLELDAEPRVVVVPPGLENALREDKSAQAAFDLLSYTHKREYVNYILEAKREETQSRRATRVVEMLKEGKKGK